MYVSKYNRILRVRVGCRWPTMKWGTVADSVNGAAEDKPSRFRDSDPSAPEARGGSHGRGAELRSEDGASGGDP